MEENIKRLEDATARAREATSEANSATKAARQAERDLRHFISEAKIILDEESDRIVRKVLEDAAEKGITQLNEDIGEQMDRAVARVNGEFDKLAALLMGIDSPGDDLETLVRREAIRRQGGVQ